jgi:hypothetical protein
LTYVLNATRSTRPRDTRYTRIVEGSLLFVPSVLQPPGAALRNWWEACSCC